MESVPEFARKINSKYEWLKVASAWKQSQFETETSYFSFSIIKWRTFVNIKIMWTIFRFLLHGQGDFYEEASRIDFAFKRPLGKKGEPWPPPHGWNFPFIGTLERTGAFQ